MCCIEFKKLLPATLMKHYSTPYDRCIVPRLWSLGDGAPGQDIGWGSFSKNPACSVLSGVKEMVEAAGIEAEQVT